jgi:hypothetical protein
VPIGNEKTAPTNETNRDRFVRIAELRVNRVLEDLDKLGRCSNRSYYSYSEVDVNQIFKEIERKVKEIKSMFLGISTSKNRFKLKR